MIPLILSLLSFTAWKDEVLCFDNGYCCPRVVNLGDWDPRPAAKDWNTDPFSGPWLPDKPSKVWAFPNHSLRE